jgi:hypothetical protein
MALSDIVFVKGQGGLGRPLPGEDYISGLLFYTANGNLPSGYSTSARITSFFSVADAETAGINGDYRDATAATFTSTIARGSTGDSFGAVYTGINGVVYNLGTYKQSSADTTLALLGASIASYINSGTYNHGCSASFTTATLTITLPKSQGVFPNSGTPLVFTVTGSLTASAATIGVSGVASKQAVWHYHISEFFRMQPQGRLYVGFYAVPGSYTFTEITTMQVFASGKIRQIGVLKDYASAYSSGDLTTIQTEVTNNCDANHMPLSVLYAADLSGTSDFTTLTDLNTLTASKVSAIVSQDGASLGAFLYIGTGKSITTLGAHLGAVAFGAVSDSIEWKAKFNFSNGSELDTPALANGTLINTLSKTTLDAIDNLRYIFLIKNVGFAGTYTNHSYTAIVNSSDYDRIENNRTIDKAIRGVYANMLPSLGSPLVLNSDGTLKDTTIAYLSSQAEINLTQMVRDTELSAFKVTISATQNVLTSGKVIVAVSLLPVGVAEAIQVNIGFVTSIS